MIIAKKISSNNRRFFGSLIEKQVVCYLEKQKLKLIVCNYRCIFGEIDIIMRDQDENSLIFVEVKYRKQLKYDEYIANITNHKKFKIMKVAANYLQKNNLFDKINCRFDVVLVEPSESVVCNIDAINNKNRKDVQFKTVEFKIEQLNGMNFFWIKDAFRMNEICMK